MGGVFWPRVVVVVIALVVLGGAAMFYRGLTHLEFGENVAAVEWLPATATNVSFHKTLVHDVYEFDISEPEFVKWSRWQLGPIKTPVEIGRYNAYERPGKPKPSALASTKPPYRVTIASGLFFDDRSQRGGTKVVYDRAEQRAYCEAYRR